MSACCLDPADIADTLRNVNIKPIGQTRESDAILQRRLGKRYDAVATVKNDTLIIMPASRSQTVSGKPLPTMHIKRQLGVSHRYHSAESDLYTSVRVFWQDDRQGLRSSVVAGTAGNAKRPAHHLLMPVNVSGFKAAINSVDWLTAKVTHSIGINGFSTAIELETKTE